MRGDGLCAAAALVAGLTVAATQLPARAVSLTVKETTDAYLLPPPDQLVVASLGYRAALADLLWAKVLVTQGIRMEQRRGFDTVGQYLEAITTLDPKWREPYRLSDTLLTFQAVEVQTSEVYKARVMLEKGVAERPLDAELWLQLGQFVAFIAAPSYLKDPDEQERWRREGAQYLARAAELGAADPNIQWQAFGGAGILARAGERDAAKRFYRLTLATATDPELQAQLENKLRALQEEEERDAYEARKAAFSSVWRARYPGRRQDFLYAAGFGPDPAACAGGSASAHFGEARCASTWAEWAERVDAERQR